MKKINRYCCTFISLSIFSLFSCGQAITITRSYIYCSNWADGDYQGFEIAKIHYLDPTVSIYDKNFNRFQLSNYIIDSNFCFYHFTGNEKYNTKSFFNQASETLRWRKCDDLKNERKTIGLLGLDTWYIIQGLKGTIDYYVYIDKRGNAHVYSLGPTNY